MLLHLGDEALLPLRVQRGQVVGDVPGEQDVPFAPSHQETGVSRAMARRRQRDDRGVQRHPPATRELAHGGSVEVEQVGHEAARHRRGQEPEQPAGEPGHRRPLRPGHPHPALVERRESSDVVSVEMGQEHAVEVSRREAPPSQLGHQILVG
jgi:hypothetical protein